MQRARVSAEDRRSLTTMRSTDCEKGKKSDERRGVCQSDERRGIWTGLPPACSLVLCVLLTYRNEENIYTRMTLDSFHKVH